jgi:hypothetical protein
MKHAGWVLQERQERILPALLLEGDMNGGNGGERADAPGSESASGLPGVPLGTCTPQGLAVCATH